MKKEMPDQPSQVYFKGSDSVFIKYGLSSENYKLIGPGRYWRDRELHSLNQAIPNKF